MFLIIEGIYVNTGEICNLPDFLKVCTEFKLRVFLDESISIGVLGSTGRGVTEHFNVNVSLFILIRSERYLTENNTKLLSDEI